MSGIFTTLNSSPIVVGFTKPLSLEGYRVLARGLLSSTQRKKTTMTFKEYANSQSHLPLGTLRANWGKIQAAVTKDLQARHGATSGGQFKISGKVNRDGLIKITHARVVPATAAEIRAQRAADATSAGKRDAHLAELESLAKADGRAGLDLFDLVAKANPAPAPALAEVLGEPANA